MVLSLRIGIFALMFLAVLMIGARFYDIAWQIIHGEAPTAFPPAKAEETATTDAPKTDATKPADKKDAPAAAPAALATDPKAADAKPADTKIDAAKLDDKKPADAKPDDKKPETAKPADASTAKPDDKATPAATTPAVQEPTLGNSDESIDELSESDINILKHLSERRQELDKRAHEIEERETLLNLTEQRVDKKITDLKKMQDDIRKILGDADAEYTKQVASMVKIYETMKPKDAARIFEAMDMPTLLEVASRMKESKAAPVIAAMNAAKARDLSAQLMAKKNLPPPP